MRPVDGGGLGEARWWLRSIVGAGKRGRRAVATAFARYAARPRRPTRASDAFTEFDGHVPAAGAVLDPCKPGTVFRSTAARGRRGVPVPALSQARPRCRRHRDGERDRDVWLDPLLRGSLLHDLYAALLRRCRAGNRRAERADDRRVAPAAGAGRGGVSSQRDAAAVRRIVERETQAFLDDLELFLEAEAQPRPVGRRSASRCRSGGAGGRDDEPLAQAEPVTIDLGGGLTLRIAGRIDRIDQVGPASFEIVDYKTGGYWAPTLEGHVRRRHAAAARALRSGGARAAQAARQESQSSRRRLLLLQRKGHQERVTHSDTVARGVAAVLGDLREVIARPVRPRSDEERLQVVRLRPRVWRQCLRDARRGQAGRSEARAVREAGGP